MRDEVIAKTYSIPDRLLAEDDNRYGPMFLEAPVPSKASVLPCPLREPLVYRPHLYIERHGSLPTNLAEAAPRIRICPGHLIESIVIIDELSPDTLLTHLVIAGPFFARLHRLSTLPRDPSFPKAPLTPDVSLSDEEWLLSHISAATIDQLGGSQMVLGVLGFCAQRPLGTDGSLPVVPPGQIVRR